MCSIWALSRFHIQRGENEKRSCRNGTGARSWRIGLNRGLILSVFDWDWLYNESLNLFELHLIFEMVQWYVTALAYGYVCFVLCVCVCVCASAWRETTWQALHFSANADLSVCCWQIQTSPDPPPSSQTSNPDRLTPSSVHPTPFTFPWEIWVWLERRGRESERSTLSSYALRDDPPATGDGNGSNCCRPSSPRSPLRAFCGSVSSASALSMPQLW